MLRFAQSPTRDLNIGDLRVAIFNYIVSKQREEDLLIRVEDLDHDKNIEGKDKELLDILALFDIKYSQIINQTQHVRFHTAMALQLIHEKKAFSCFCSDQWIENKKQEAKASNKEYHYDDACRDLPAELVIDNENPFRIRIKRPDETITIDDKIKGKISFDPDKVDSFIIMNQDKTPTYNFASAVDDMLNDISIVISDEKHIDNTPKQVHVRDALKYDKTIEYAHIPTITNDSEFTIKSLLKDGYLPEAISNYLISIGNNPPSTIFTTKEAIKWFDISKVSNTPVHFDIETLKKINKEHLKNLDAKELSRYVGFADEEIGELARIYLEEVDTTEELRSKIKPIFSPRIVPDNLTKDVEAMKDVIKGAPYFDKYEDFKNYVVKESGLNDESFLTPLRILLTNAQSGPDISNIYKYLKNYIGEIIK